MVVRFYNKRGTAEQWIKEGKQAVKMTRLSCHRFRSNQVRLALSLLAYNLGNLWRRLALPTEIENWSLTSLQQRLVKTGGRLVKHARYYWLLLAQSHLTRRRFGSMVRRIAALPLPAGWPRLREPGNGVQTNRRREGCVTKPDGKAVVNRCRTRAGAHRTLCRVLGSAEESIHAVEPRKGCTVSGCWELKRKFRLTSPRPIRTERDTNFLSQGPRCILYRRHSET